MGNSRYWVSSILLALLRSGGTLFVCLLFFLLLSWFVFVFYCCFDLFLFLFCFVFFFVLFCFSLFCFFFAFCFCYFFGGDLGLLFFRGRKFGAQFNLANTRWQNPSNSITACTIIYTQTRETNSIQTSLRLVQGCTPNGFSVKILCTLWFKVISIFYFISFYFIFSVWIYKITYKPMENFDLANQLFSS